MHAFLFLPPGRFIEFRSPGRKLKRVFAVCCISLVMQVEAFEAWKMRELACIKRGREERNKQVRVWCIMNLFWSSLLVLDVSVQENVRKILLLQAHEASIWGNEEGGGGE